MFTFVRQCNIISARWRCCRVFSVFYVDSIWKGKARWDLFSYLEAAKALFEHLPPLKKCRPLAFNFANSIAACLNNLTI